MNIITVIDDQFQRIQFVHGTNSAILPALAQTNHQFFATKTLLNHGLVPMSGKITMGGVRPNGIKQSSLSGYRLNKITESWKTYALGPSHSFNPETLTREIFCEFFEILMKLTPICNEWDPTIILLTIYKQWDSKLFDELCKEHQTEIASLVNRIKNLPSPEVCLLKALDYPVEKLRQAITDLSLRNEIMNELGFNHQALEPWISKLWSDVPDKIFNLFPGCENYKLSTFLPGKFDYMLLEIINLKLTGTLHESQELTQGRSLKENGGMTMWVPYDYIKKMMENRGSSSYIFSDRKNRCLRLFDPNHRPLEFKTEDEKLCITSAFPIIFGSTKLSPSPVENDEVVVPSGVKLGEGIDVLFVREKDYPFTAAWLQEQNLSDRVAVYAAEVFLKNLCY